MTEPIRLNPNVCQVVIELDGTSEATALRELADWLDAEMTADEYVLHSVTFAAANDRFNEPNNLLLALVEDTSEEPHKGHS